MHRKNYEAVMNSKVYIIFLLSFFLFAACKDDYPKSEKECIKEAKTMLEFIHKGDYENLLTSLKKYETFEKYDLSETQKVYGRLHDYLQGKSLEKVKYTLKRDTLGIESLNWSKVAFFEMNFFSDTVREMKEESSFCMFRYAIGIEEKHYYLQMFFDNFKKKLPLPIVTTTPPPPAPPTSPPK